MVTEPRNPAVSRWEYTVRWLRAQPDQQALVVDGYYDDPLSAAAERYWGSDEWAAVRSLLPAQRGKALDVGAGRGIASFALAREGFTVTALEPDPSALVGAGAIRSLARDTCLPIEVRQEFSERLPFADGEFDIVFARAMLHHTRDLQATCAEFFRVLRPGGWLLAVREHVVSRPEDLPAFLRNHPLHRLYGGEHAYLLDEYVGSIGQAGFVLERVLGPLQSPVNYAPHTQASLQREVAARASRNLPMVRGALRRLLGVPMVWSAAVTLLARLDNRPGRLYSFVATRPA